MKASIFINYKKYRSKFSIAEMSEEASFDTDRSSFVNEAATLIEALHDYVTNAKTRGRW